MKRESVKSSSVKSIGCEECRMIEVEFQSGDVYLYTNVELGLFEEIQSSPSIGSVVNKLLIKAGYPCYKMVVLKSKDKK